MQTQEWIAPTFTVLTWEQVLESQGLAPLESDPRHVQLEDTHGVRIPAQPVRDGGTFWHKRADIFHSKQERNKRPRLLAVCPECRKDFQGTKRAKFCSHRCQNKAGMRRIRSMPVVGKLTNNGEETNQ